MLASDYSLGTRTFKIENNFYKKYTYVGEIYVLRMVLSLDSRKAGGEGV